MISIQKNLYKIVPTTIGIVGLMALLYYQLRFPPESVVLILMGVIGIVYFSLLLGEVNQSVVQGFQTINATLESIKNLLTSSAGNPSYTRHTGDTDRDPDRTRHAEHPHRPTPTRTTTFPRKEAGFMLGALTGSIVLFLVLDQFGVLYGAIGLLLGSVIGGIIGYLVARIVS